MTSIYNPVEYWKKRGKNYYRDFRYSQSFINQEVALLNFITNNNLRPKSILEVGCGFGRITNILLDNIPSIIKYDAIDISRHQIRRAKAIVNNNKAKFTVSSIMDFNSDIEYDLIVAIEVLMHTPPKEIKQAIDKLMSLGKQLLHVDYSVDISIGLASHNFNHDYISIHGDNLKSKERIDKQVMFLTK